MLSELSNNSYHWVDIKERIKSEISKLECKIAELNKIRLQYLDRIENAPDDIRVYSQSNDCEYILKGLNMDVDYYRREIKKYEDAISLIENVIYDKK